ncbi:MAG TPA: hypothetical protein VN639_15740 [Azonexus sp.]|nr:hypothetical protein [Azonexus sp.]
MAGGFDSFYYGNMAAPTRLPNGTLVAAPTYAPPTSVDELYRGIVPQSTPSNGRLYDVGYDPGSPVSSAYTGGWGSRPTSVPTRLSPSSPNVDLPGMGGVNPSVLAYGAPGRNYGVGAKMSVDNPGLAAIRSAAPAVPHIVPTGSAWKNGWGADVLRMLMFPSEANGMPIDSSIPTNSPAYGRRPSPLGLARQQPTRAPRMVAPPTMVPNHAGGGQAPSIHMGNSGYTIIAGDNGVPGNSGNWFNQVTERPALPVPAAQQQQAAMQSVLSSKGFPGSGRY